jgi:hypothetical protein
MHKKTLIVLYAVCVHMHVTGEGLGWPVYAQGRDKTSSKTARNEDLLLLGVEPVTVSSGAAQVYPRGLRSLSH